MLSQIESEEVRCSLLLLASARFSLDCFPIEDSSDRADLVTISDGLKKFYKRSIADHLANRFQSDSTTSAVLGHQLKLFTLLTSTDESWALYRKEIAKQLRRQFDGKSLSELGDLKKELERQMTNDFQLLVSNGFEIDLGPSEALNLVYLDQIKEILQMKIPPIEGPAKKQLVNEILLVIKFANDIEEISEKLHKQLIFKDETSTTPGSHAPLHETA